MHNLLSDVAPKNKLILSLVNDFESGRWRRNKFEEFIWNYIGETSLSKDEKDSLIYKPQSIITKSAKNLRLTNGDTKGGEIGEILLYGIMKKYYSALPVVPKIFYKQNRNDYAKGADSIHITLDENNNFSIWLGEAKFYNSLENRLDPIVESIVELLSVEKLRKELNIVTSLKDIELCISNRELRDNIINKLKDGISLDEIKPHLHVPIMLLHECEITASTQVMDIEYKNKIIEKNKKIAEIFIKKQDAKLTALHGYSGIHFHLIFFPIPNKSDIVDRFYRKAFFERNED